MKWIVIIGLFLLLLTSVEFRIFLINLPVVLYYLLKDVYKYFRYKQYNTAPIGKMDCYCAHFGRGKTLSAVAYISAYYQQYNNKRVWDSERKMFVVQKVHILTNVHLKTIPYELLENMNQFLACASHNKRLDEKNGTRTVTICFVDEASSEFNSRNFKDNISPEVLRVMVTQRHYYMNYIYSSQKFKLSDALMRSVTRHCIWCEKKWRFMVQYVYNADEMENVANPDLLQPLRKLGWFIRDKHFNEYDTYAVVDHLEKSVKNKDLLTEEQVLALRGNYNTDMDAVKPSRKYMRLQKKMRR